MSDDKPLDAGAFFDRPTPPALSWIQPALACVVCIAFALAIAFGDATTTRNLGCSAWFVLGASVFQTVMARYAERADALRRKKGERYEYGTRSARTRSMKRTADTLTEAEKRRIVDAVRDKVPTRTIAGRFSIPENTVIELANEAGITFKRAPKTLTVPQRQHLARIVDAGGTVSMLSSAYDKHQDYNRQTMRFLAKRKFITFVEAGGKGNPATATITEDGIAALAKSRAEGAA